MDFHLTSEQELIRKTARDFAAQEIAPHAAQWDREAHYPAETVKKMAELGFMGIFVPEEWGGAGMDHVSYSLAVEEISRADASCGVIMSVNNSLTSWPLLAYGSDARSGRTDPRKVDPRWLIAYPRRDIKEGLVRALDEGSVLRELHAMPPRHQGYQRLREALQQYRDISARGGWNPVG